MSIQICRLSTILLTFWLTTPAQAATLFGVVSTRSAPELAAGVETFHRAHPGHTYILRTPEQLAAMTDTELTALWRKADAVLLAAVFGDAVPRLQRLLEQSAPALTVPVLAINGDARLTRLSRLNGQRIFAGLSDAALQDVLRAPDAEEDPVAHAAGLAGRYPPLTGWLQARAYWQARGSDNLAGLVAWLVRTRDSAISVPLPRSQPSVRYYHHGNILAGSTPTFGPDKPVVVLLDHDTGDRAGDRELLDEMCRALDRRGLACFAALARWGQASAGVLRELPRRVAPTRIAALVVLQDFVVGGGEGREAATAAFESLDVPVFKGIRLTDRTETQWRLAEDGLPWDGVHYRVAMPELQGMSQPLVLAAATPARIDPLTGLALSVTRPLPAQVETASARIARWVTLQQKSNADKRVAIVYYNHPPGRHNIGADNLDVPASMWETLRRLRAEGYDTGELPDSPEALLTLMQERGVNLPENGPALATMADSVATLDAAEYTRWFERLPVAVQGEMRHGPLGYLHAGIKQATVTREVALGRKLLGRVHGDLRHLLEGAAHPARAKALDQLEQLKTAYEAILDGKNRWRQADKLVAALRATGIEGLAGWGEPPGWIMVHNRRLLVPGLTFGNIFIGPQPPRGWELDQELLHANMSFPPPHQYLGFYHWLRDVFRADAVIHLGRHSTYEFLPRRRVGLTADDYPAVVAADLPGIYPYIVDGVGEGIQAKRRGLAVIVDHLTPPLRTTPLYDELLQLRQLIESFEAAPENSPARIGAVAAIRHSIDKLKLRDELATNMRDVLQVRGIGFEQIDDQLLVHEVGHYLTKLQERFMPHGLHVFGRAWSSEAVDMMLTSMGGGTPAESHRAALTRSPRAEQDALLAALAGRFVPPGKGNDPIRTSEALPTGRNFHALDGGLLPTRIGYELGARLATEARRTAPGAPSGTEAVVLWASDTVRDEGAMVAFGLDMLGIRPVWNSRGILQGLERLVLEPGRVRRDTVFTTSGLFRDLYANLLVWLDRAVLLALDGASNTIRREHPELVPALEAALAPLGDLARPGAEDLATNQVAAHWVESVKALYRQGMDPATAGRQASLRLFGDVPGAYGAGVNRLVERSGAWRERKQIAHAYLMRMGHAYGVDQNGAPAHAVLRTTLARVENTYLGRATNLYGLMDNNDAFDYLGGLSLAVETLTGRVPQNRVVDHADPGNTSIEPLQTALLRELRGRYLNPAWLKPLMQHGYAGARTMGTEFLENLWGWQVTNPDIVKNWIWDEVKRVYIDDGLKLGLNEFLERGHNAHVKTNMLAILLVAAHKDFWQPDAATLRDVTNRFAALVVQHGLPGSGHTRPDHPMLAWVQPRLDPALRAEFARVLQTAQVVPTTAVYTTKTPAAKKPDPAAKTPARASEIQIVPRTDALFAAMLGLTLSILFAGGAAVGQRTGA